MPTTPELYGIENLKSAIHLAIAIPVDGIAAVKSKFAVFNILKFVNDVTDLVAFYRNKDLVKLELKDIHADERVQLIEHFKSEFVLTNKEAEGLIEDGLSWANTTVSLFERAKTLIKK